MLPLYISAFIAYIVYCCSELTVTVQVYVLKRPYIDEFLQKMGEMFECILFTASLAKVLLTVVVMSSNLLLCN